MGNSWLDITKIFISNLFAGLDGTVERTTESAVNETLALTNNARNLLSSLASGRQEATAQAYSESKGHFGSQEP